MDVLLAVQHAHQRQLLHRDLKPSNILVTELDQVPMVKVIDFGISLGIDETAGEARQKGQRAGTPGYSSPESLEPDGADLGLDTRSDVYTLGIVLYELCCGRRPFDAPGDSMQEVWRKINEDTPLHPAQQISMMDTKTAEGIAAARGTRPARLIKTISSDLDAIIMKAISRDREDRYASVAAFYDDLSNFLNRKPVSAQSQDFTYLVGLFAQRNLGFVAAGTLLIGAMVVGLVAWSGEARRANLEAERASREALAAAGGARGITRVIEFPGQPVQPDRRGQRCAGTHDHAGTAGSGRQQPGQHGHHRSAVPGHACGSCWARFTQNCSCWTRRRPWSARRWKHGGSCWVPTTRRSPTAWDSWRISTVPR